MGTIAAQVIITRAQKTLFDETGVQWAPAELLDYLNAGLSAIVTAKPDAFIVNAPFELGSSSKQVLPAKGVQFFDLIRNLGADGETPGKAIRATDRNFLDHSDPDWHTKTGPAVLHYVHDPRDPKVFYIFPQVSGTWNVELSYSASPDRITDANTVIPIDDIYENPLHNWICAYAYAKNTKRTDVNKQNNYLTLFANALGLKTQLQVAFAPVNPDAEQQAP